jgi:hypothetical protein
MLELRCKYRGRSPLSFDGVNVSWPDTVLSKPSKKRNLTVNVVDITAINLHISRVVGHMEISFPGVRRNQRMFVFKLKDKLLAEVIKGEILKAKADPTSYVLPVASLSNHTHGKNPLTIPPPLADQPIKNSETVYAETKNGPTRIEQLKILSELRDDGTLTDAEFQEEKRRILGT